MGIYRREIQKSQRENRKVQRKQRRVAVKQAIAEWLRKNVGKIDQAVEKAGSSFDRWLDKVYEKKHKKELVRRNKDLARAALEFEEMLRLRGKSLTQEDAQEMQIRFNRKIAGLAEWNGAITGRIELNMALIVLVFTPLCVLCILMGTVVLPVRLGLSEFLSDMISIGLFGLSLIASFVVVPEKAARRADQYLAEWKVLEHYCHTVGIKHIYCNTTIFDNCDFRRYLPDFFPVLNSKNARNFDTSHEKAREILAS